MQILFVDLFKVAVILIVEHADLHCEFQLFPLELVQNFLLGPFALFFADLHELGKLQGLRPRFELCLLCLYFLLAENFVTIIHMIARGFNSFTDCLRIRH